MWIKFDNPRVGRVSDVSALINPREHVAIAVEPATGRFESVGSQVYMTRTQMPILLCWAATVHKVQGITLDYAVMCLRSPFSPALAYVALSRVRTLAGVCLLHLGERKKIAWAHASVSKEHARLRKIG